MKCGELSNRNRLKVYTTRLNKIDLHYGKNKIVKDKHSLQRKRHLMKIAKQIQHLEALLDFDVKGKTKFKPTG